MLKRLIISFLITLLITFTSFSSISSADALDEAEVLSDLNLLKGNGESYDLFNKLKRSEAATFIVKLLGDETLVLDNRKEFITSVFDDVEPEAWYAPYIGYCYGQGIVSGFEDGTFRPDEFVSEKAFLSMLLSALNYEADEDFDWNTVLVKAYETGLSNDIGYAVRIEDNTEYLRKDVVHTIYNALKQFVNDEEYTVADRLVNKQVTSNYMLNKHDLLRKDELITEIEDIEILTSRTLVITFNEEIAPLIKSQLSLELDGKNVEIIKVDQESSHLTLTTEVELYGEKMVEATVNSVTDMEGYSVDKLSISIEALEKKAVESNIFMVSYIDQVDENIIDVYFTHPISDQVEEALMYKFGRRGTQLTDGSFKSLSAIKMGAVDNGVSLVFDSFTIDQGDEYELYIRGDLESVYGVNLNNGNGETVKFTGSGEKLSEFEVDDYEVVDPYYVVLEFSRSVDDKTANKTENYKLTNLENTKVYYPTKIEYFADDEGSYRDKVVLKYSSIKADVEYELEVKGIFDQYLSTQMDPFSDEFEEKKLVTYRPELDDVVVVDRTTIKLIYSEVLDEKSEKAEFDIEHNIKVEMVKVNDENPTELILYFDSNDKLNEDEKYEIVVEDGIFDYLGRQAKYNEKETFYGKEDHPNEIEIESVEYISEELIFITFSDYVNEKEVMNLNNYEVKYISGRVEREFYPYNVEQIDGKKVLLSVESYFDDGQMYLTIKEVKDYSEEYTYKDIEKEIIRSLD